MLSVNALIRLSAHPLITNHAAVFHERSHGWVTESACRFIYTAGRWCLPKRGRGPGRGYHPPCRWVGVPPFLSWDGLRFFAFFLTQICNGIPVASFFPNVENIGGCRAIWVSLGAFLDDLWSTFGFVVAEVRGGRGRHLAVANFDFFVTFSYFFGDGIFNFFSRCKSLQVVASRWKSGPKCRLELQNPVANFDFFFIVFVSCRF